MVSCQILLVCFENENAFSEYFSYIWTESKNYPFLANKYLGPQIQIWFVDRSCSTSLWSYLSTIWKSTSRKYDVKMHQPKGWITLTYSTAENGMSSISRKSSNVSYISLPSPLFDNKKTANASKPYGYKQNRIGIQYIRKTTCCCICVLRVPLRCLLWLFCTFCTFCTPLLAIIIRIIVIITYSLAGVPIFTTKSNVFGTRIRFG